MALISTGSVNKALWPGVNAWFGLSYNEHPLECSEIFETLRSEKNFEEDVNVYGFGLATVKPETGSIQYDESGQGWVQRYTHVAYGLGFIISREAVEDNLYMELAQKRTKALAFSMRQTKENVAANILNRAFNSSYTYADGIELCSTVNEKSKGGTFGNELVTAADLSELALEQACIDIMNMTNDASLKVRLMPRKLIIPPALAFEAERILKSSLQSDNSSNALNALKSKGVLPEGYTVNHYLTDADAFFIKTDCQDGLKLFQRRDVAIENDTDFDTSNLKYKATERYSVGASDKRGIFGSPGA
mgnify:CR=1 FL=1